MDTAECEAASIVITLAVPANFNVSDERTPLVKQLAIRSTGQYNKTNLCAPTTVLCVQHLVLKHTTPTTRSPSKFCGSVGNIIHKYIAATNAPQQVASAAPDAV